MYGSIENTKASACGGWPERWGVGQARCATLRGARAFQTSASPFGSQRRWGRPWKTYGISNGALTELLSDVSKALAERPWVKDGGYYVLVPEDFSNSMWKGVLEIYPTGKEEEPLMGIYETVPVEDENGDTYALWQFTYNGEKRLFTRTVSGNGKCVLAENVTPFCPSGLLPEGALVVYREMFLLRTE